MIVFSVIKPIARNESLIASSTMLNLIPLNTLRNTQGYRSASLSLQHKTFLTTG